MVPTVPPSEPTRHNVDDLLALVEIIRRHAFDVSVPPAESLIDIRDALREYTGEFADQE